MGSHQVRFGETDFTIFYPHTCPVCHSEIDPRAYANSQRGAELDLGFVCSNNECRRLFIALYRLDTPPNGRIAGMVPTVPDLSASYSDLIRQLSPNFIEIYSQASTAQALELHQISGPGFRKAFEFLVKDYAKSLTSDAAAITAIESQLAGAVVSKYIPDPRIQAVARRALWLGNDETHYIRKWTDRNIDDMLTLIRLAVNWIEIERLSSKYNDEMPG